jgi:radical SAM protein with 4Fe4S-binding SPASM domain
MPQVKEVKKQIIAGPAIQTFEFFIQWHLTERCNLRCRHCYQGRKKVPEMTPGDVRREIDGAAEMFLAWEKEHGIRVSPSIHFTGGEPFLYEGLWDVIKHARDGGFKTALMSNGSLISEEDAQRVFDLAVEDIQISLEGPEDVHDRIRGRGSFLSALEGAKRLIAAGSPVSANVTLSRLNHQRIEETIHLAREAGFSSIGFSRVVPCGRGKTFLRDMLSPFELRAAYETIVALNSPDFEVLSGDPLAGVVSGVRSSPGISLSLSGCSAGFSGVTVTSDGSVMPCRRIGLVAGSLKKQSLREIWASSSMLWKLRQRESYRGKCGLCDLWPSCRGCRAVAYAWSAARGKPDLFADDPQCCKE